MNLEFKKYEGSETTLESLGTVANIVGKDGKLGLIPSNFKNPNKRVSIILTKKDGTSTMVSCSAAVSAGLRDKSITLGNVLTFEVLYGEAEVPFISLPGGAGVAETTVKSLVAEDFEVTSAVSLEDLIAL